MKKTPITQAALRVARENPKFRAALMAQIQDRIGTDKKASLPTEDEWSQVHEKMNKNMASKIKERPTASNWWTSSTPLPRDKGDGMYFQCGTQMSRGKYEAYLSFWEPMFSDSRSWIPLYMDLGDLLRKYQSKASSLGKAKFYVNNNNVQLWIDVDATKSDAARKVLPEIASQLGSDTARLLRQHKSASSTKTAGGRLISSLRKEINKDLRRAGFDGRGRFRRPQEGYSKALDVLRKYGIELGNVPSSHLFKGPQGVLTVDLAFSNPEDPFSPEDIDNSLLRLDFTEVGNGYEMIGYLS